VTINSNRRQFFSAVGATAAAMVGSGFGPLSRAVPAAAQNKRAHEDNAGERSRRQNCVRIKKDAAVTNAEMPIPPNMPNGDEESHPSLIGNYHKGLPHGDVGEVDLRAYRSMLHTLNSGHSTDFENIALGGNAKLSNPQGGLAFDLEGCDSQQTSMATPPALNSSWRAGEMVENYWMALLRDVSFSDYVTSTTSALAIAELNKLDEFRGPRQRGQVTPQTLFRGCTPGDLAGPYVSQFLLQPIRFGALHVNQQIASYEPGSDS
jgi:hypothetical protein